MAALAELADTISVAADAISTNFELQQHVVEIEAVLHAASKARTPRCVAGARACPPEDCGGAAGYVQLLRTLAGRMTDARRELLDWLGEPFDPEVFRVADVNARLASLR